MSKPLDQYHFITFNQANRRCGGYRCDCPNTPIVCVHGHWNTGNTTGVSFWDYCLDHLAIAYPAMYEKVQALREMSTHDKS